MNVYEEAHNLARAIKESNEFKDYDAKRKELEGDEDLKKMIADFQQFQIQLQTKQMMGEQLDQENVQQLQNLYGMLMTKPKASEYMQSEARFSIMIKDVYEILAEVMNIQF